MAERMRPHRSQLDSLCLFTLWGERSLPPSLAPQGVDSPASDAWVWLLGDPDGNVATELVVPAAGHVGLTWTSLRWLNP